jgi:hypothetical protein
VEQHLEFGSYEVLPLSMEGPAALAALRLGRALQERFVQVVCVHTEDEQLVAAMAARLAERAAVLRRVPVGQTVPVSQWLRVALKLTSTGFVYGSDEDLHRAPTLKGARLAPVVVPIGVKATLYENVRPVSHTAIGVPADARVLVCCYDPSGRARAANVLRVAGLLTPRHSNLHLVFIGPGSDDEDLRMHAAALRITKSVSFLGPRDDHLGILGLAELGWVVGNGDDGAYALLDLLASRVPVIAERGTLAQLYVPDGIAGLVLPPGDAYDTAAAVARLLAQEDQRAAMGNAGRTRLAREHTEAIMVEAFERAAVAASDRSQW